MTHVMVPFVNGKGGVGKTALACSYGVARAQQGAEVLVMDVNEGQRTALAWGQVREHNKLLPSIRVEAADPRRALEMVGRCEVLIVDTPGWTDKTTLALARRSTLTVIPTGPNPTYDLAPTVRLLHGLRAEGIEARRLCVVLSRLSAEEPARQQEEAFARAYLKEAGYSALDACVRNAPAYSAALAQGHGLTETEGAEALRSEAVHLMDTIASAVAASERRLQQQSVQHRGKDRDRGGRDE